jgi:hypothetical protein
MAIEEMRQMQSRTENVNIKVVELESELNGKNVSILFCCIFSIKG